MVEDIDYKALFEQVQGELEAARIAILNMRTTTHPLTKLDMASVRKFVAENYLVLLVVFMLLSFIVSSLKAIRELFKP